MINHDSRPEYRVAFQYDAKAGTEGLMRVVSRRAYEAGEQVFLVCVCVCVCVWVRWVRSDASRFSPGVFCALNPKPHAVDKQVFLAYGDKSNDSLLQNYGFSEEGNAFDNFRLFSLLSWLEENQASENQVDISLPPCPDPYHP
jgi:hypothetical protein